jgi:hypothetical protein
MKHQTFNEAAKSGMFAQVVLASRHPVTGTVVYTLHLRYPRIIHGEMMTHRVFNRNARSSRAVPVKTLLEEIRNDPFVPWHWTRNQRGMQGEKGWDALVRLPTVATSLTDGAISYTPWPYSNEGGWLWARDRAVEAAEAFMHSEYHKQIANRLVEPFMWMDLLVTATDWRNFLHLRDHPDAEPHIRDLAQLVGQALDTAEIHDLSHRSWHLPYISDEDRDDAHNNFGHDIEEGWLWLRKISAARCARISYKPFDGDATYERELERYEQLVGHDAVHASPLEHQCRPDKIVTVETSYWDGDDMLKDDSTEGGLNPHLHGSLRDFVQFRKTVPNEAIHG